MVVNQSERRGAGPDFYSDRQKPADLNLKLNISAVKLELAQSLSTYGALWPQFLSLVWHIIGFDRNGCSSRLLASREPVIQLSNDLQIAIQSRHLHARID